MSKRPLVILAFCSAMFVAPGITVAADQDRDQEREQSQTQDQAGDQDRLRDQDIYGWQLMSPEERAQFRTKMRAAKTAEERELIRKEHHERMAAIAKEKGVTLPEEPPERGMERRMDHDMAPGSGMGPGGGRRW